MADWIQSSILKHSQRPTKMTVKRSLRSYNPTRMRMTSEILATLWKLGRKQDSVNASRPSKLNPSSKKTENQPDFHQRSLQSIGNWELAKQSPLEGVLQLMPKVQRTGQSWLKEQSEAQVTSLEWYKWSLFHSHLAK